MQRSVVEKVCFFLAGWAVLQTCPAGDPLIEVHIEGRRIEGTPLDWSPRRVTLLTPGGVREDISPVAVERFRQLNGIFAPCSQRQARRQVRSEFGPAFSVTATEHYLVVHPRDSRDLWGPHLETLYRDFHGFFRHHACSVEKVRFPLVVIVLPSRDDLLRSATRGGRSASARLAGYYCDRSNRIWIHTAPPTAGRLPLDATVTLRHEAAHQLAFNTGIHPRFGTTPLWVAEGLAVLFEMPSASAAVGAEASPTDHQVADRLAVVRVTDKLSRRSIGLQSLIDHDRDFQRTPDAAYSQSASLTRFLVARHVVRYLRYLKCIASRPHFSRYRTTARRADFESSFGADLARLETSWKAHVDANP